MSLNCYKWRVKKKINLSKNINIDDDVKAFKYKFVKFFGKLENNELKYLDNLVDSKHNSNKNEREIRFADAGQHFQSLDQDDWNKLKENL